MMRAIRPAACLALLLAAACGPKPRPNTMRDLQQNDVGVCYKSSAIGNANLHGHATLFTYVDADGAIPAAWFHDMGTIDSPTFVRCMISYALESKLAAEPIDHLALWELDCEESGCALRSVGKPGDAPFDQANAQATLAFADWADATDKGWGDYYAHKYSDAQAAFESVVAAHPDDSRALRGLAMTLVESNGDLKRARELADKAVAAKREAASLEALARVCAKTNDDDCLLRSFQDATKADDIKSRSLELMDLQPAAQAAGQRLKAQADAADAQQAAARAAQEAKLAKADPLGCYKLTGAELARCGVRSCFEAGAAAYAKELSKLSGKAYVTLEATAAPGAGGSTIVTIPVRLAGKHAGKADTTQDATWSVPAGNQGLTKATSFSASAIAKDHNACK